jgi:hypothetical protein
MLPLIFPKSPQSLFSRVGDVRRSYTTSNNSGLLRSYHVQTNKRHNRFQTFQSEADLTEWEAGKRLLEMGSNPRIVSITEKDVFHANAIFWMPVSHPGKLLPGVR